MSLIHVKQELGESFVWWANRSLISNLNNLFMGSSSGTSVKTNLKKKKQQEKEEEIISSFPKQTSAATVTLHVVKSPCCVIPLAQSMCKSQAYVHLLADSGL